MSQYKLRIVDQSERTEYLEIENEIDYISDDKTSLDPTCDYFLSINPHKGDKSQRIEKIILRLPKRNMKVKDHTELIHFILGLLEQYNNAIIVRDAVDAVDFIISIIPQSPKNLEQIGLGMEAWIAEIAYELKNSKFAKNYSIFPKVCWETRLLGSTHQFEQVKQMGEHKLEGEICLSETILAHGTDKTPFDKYKGLINIREVIDHFAPECLKTEKVDEGKIYILCPIHFVRTDELPPKDTFYYTMDGTFKDLHNQKAGDIFDLALTLTLIKEKSPNTDTIFKFATNPKKNWKLVQKVLEGIAKGGASFHTIRSTPIGYYKYRKSGGTYISNFILKPSKMIIWNEKENQKRVRFVHIVNSQGESTEPIPISSDYFQKPDKFRAFCTDYGNYWFKGNISDLMDIFSLLENAGYNIIRGVPHYGFFTEGDDWYYITNDVLITPKGFIGEDREGDFKVSGQKIRPYDIPQGIKGPQFKNILSTNSEKFKNLVRSYLLLDMPEIFGQYQSIVGLGWVFAVPFAPVLREMGYMFPLLIVTGVTEAGKTKLGQILSHFFGHDQTFPAPEISEAGLSVNLPYYSGAFFHIEECRKFHYEKFEHYLRGFYDLGQSMKATPDRKPAESIPPRGCLFLDGEGCTEDSALFSRSIVIRCVMKTSKTRTKFERFWKQSYMASSLMAHYIQWGVRNKSRIILKCDEYRKELGSALQMATTERLINNFSTIILGFSLFADFVVESGCLDRGDADLALKSMWSQVIHNCKRQKREGDAMVFWQVFLDEINYLKRKGMLPQDSWKIREEEKELLIRWKEWWAVFTRTWFSTTGKQFGFSSNDVRNALADVGVLKRKGAESYNDGKRRWDVADLKEGDWWPEFV